MCTNRVPITNTTVVWVEFPLSPKLARQKDDEDSNVVGGKSRPHGQRHRELDRHVRLSLDETAEVVPKDRPHITVALAGPLVRKTRDDQFLLDGLVYLQLCILPKLR